MRKLPLFIVPACSLFIYSFAIAGSLDVFFNTWHGYVLYDNPSGNDSSGFAVLSSPDGRILVAGQQKRNRESDALIVRCTPTGEMDPEFGRDGMVLYGSRSHSEEGVALAAGKEHTLYVAGGVSYQGRLSSLIVKFDSNGRQLQKWSFAGMGGVPVGQSAFNLATDIAVQQDGKPVVCGWAEMDTAFQRNTVLYTLRLFLREP